MIISALTKGSYAFLLTLMISFVLTGCESEEIKVHPIRDGELVYLKEGEQFRNVLSEYIPMEGGYSISKHPDNFKISEIKWTERGLEYFYTPPKGFTGYDEVVIKNCISSGSSNCMYTSTILITFLIEE